MSTIIHTRFPWCYRHGLQKAWSVPYCSVCNTIGNRAWHPWCFFYFLHYSLPSTLISHDYFMLLNASHQVPAARLNITTFIPSIRIISINLRWSSKNSEYITEIPLLLKEHLYIQTAPIVKLIAVNHIIYMLRVSASGGIRYTCIWNVFSPGSNRSQEIEMSFTIKRCI